MAIENDNANYIIHGSKKLETIFRLQIVTNRDNFAIEKLFLAVIDLQSLVTICNLKHYVQRVHLFVGC